MACHYLPCHNLLCPVTNVMLSRHSQSTQHVILCDASLDIVHHALHAGSFLVCVVSYLKKPLRQVCGMKQIIRPRNLQLVTIFA